jgi:hypothetical protein
MATEVERLEGAIQNSLKETHSIESQLQDHSFEAIPQADDTTHKTQDPWDQSVVIRHRSIEHQGKRSLL